jgi:NDP-sugar pyrophosphorylase family protein
LSFSAAARGLRLRGYSELIPKPMVPIGGRPLLWHIMKSNAHYGHTEFVLCLGHQLGDDAAPLADRR